MDKRHGGRVDSDHISWPWLVRHAAWLLNRYHTGPSGKTAFNQLNSMAYTGEAMEFGETVLW